MTKKAFTFVELLMVLVILGVIASLTLPLMKNILNKDDINRSYLRKAILTVTDAYNLVSLRTRNFTVYPDTCVNCDFKSAGDCTYMRNAFKLAFTGTDCASDDCGSSMGEHPGIIAGGKSLVLFEKSIEAASTRLGYIYYDINGNKGPNEYCKDRYKFVIYESGITLDNDTCGSCINLSIQ